MYWIIDHLITLAIGFLGGIGVYWYFVTHRGLVNPPKDVNINTK